MSTSTLSIVQLRCFVRIVETGSFVEAGRGLGLTTSAVSKTMSRLEETAGIRLLNRSTHSLSLTPEGEELIGLARETVQRIDVMDGALGAAARLGVQGRVRLGAPTGFLRTCLVPLLPAFRASHPDIILDLRGSDMMADLADAGLDLAMRSGSVNGVPGHLQQTLCRSDWVACASPAYLASRGRPKDPAELAEHDLIGFRNQRTGIVDSWRFGGSRSGRPEIRWTPDSALILDDANAVKAAAVAGVGIAWSPHWLVADALRCDQLHPVLSEHGCDPALLSLIRRNHTHNPKRTEQVMAFLKDNAARFE